jgi:hypothetical protein
MTIGYPEAPLFSVTRITRKSKKSAKPVQETIRIEISIEEYEKKLKY